MFLCCLAASDCFLVPLSPLQAREGCERRSRQWGPHGAPFCGADRHVGRLCRTAETVVLLAQPPSPLTAAARRCVFPLQGDIMSKGMQLVGTKEARRLADRRMDPFPASTIHLPECALAGLAEPTECGPVVCLGSDSIVRRWGMSFSSASTSKLRANKIRFLFTSSPHYFRLPLSARKQQSRRVRSDAPPAGPPAGAATTPEARRQRSPSIFCGGVRFRRWDDGAP